jgi:hypothetical protein
MHESQQLSRRKPRLLECAARPERHGTVFAFAPHKMIRRRVLIVEDNQDAGEMYRMDGHEIARRRRALKPVDPEKLRSVLDGCQ